MILQYTEMCSNTNTQIDCTQSRDYFAVNAEVQYCSQFKKRKTARTLEYFKTDAGAFHKVRDILEEIETDDFKEVAARFTELYLAFHSDWQSALKCGLVVKAGEREHTGAPYHFQDELAARIREAGINFLDPIIKELLSTAQQPQIIQLTIF